MAMGIVIISTRAATDSEEEVGVCYKALIEA